jgi:hypothetical protein
VKRRLLESGVLIFSRSDVPSLDLRDGDETISVLIEFQDHPPDAPLNVPQLSWSSVDQLTAKATFKGKQQFGVAYGPVRLGTLANQPLVSFFNVTQASEVITLQYSFWLEVE